MQITRLVSISFSYLIIQQVMSTSTILKYFIQKAYLISMVKHTKYFQIKTGIKDDIE
jgi:hypothetical protein